MAGNGHWAAALAYFFPLIGGLLVFFLSKDSFDKFHALQALFLGILLIILSPLGLSVGGIIWLVLVIIMAIKAFQGDRFKIPLIGDLAEKYTH